MEEKNVGGRPHKEIDKRQFEELCKIQCNKEEICSVLGCGDSCLSDWCKREYGVGFQDIYKTKSAGGKASLRRIQFELAKRNASMAIFLGKQYLGQRDVALEDEEVEKLRHDVVNAIRGIREEE